MSDRKQGMVVWGLCCGFCDDGYDDEATKLNINEFHESFSIHMIQNRDKLVE
jgi:hypothetical protein